MALEVTIGIIGGTGLDDPDIMKDKTEIYVDTPFGKPSDILIKGKISGVNCVLLARHGRKHSISPTNINYRANLYALRSVGCTHVVVTTACGSLQEDKKPGDIVVLDQFIDRTQKRIQTFYDGKHEEFRGILHLPFDTPFCPHTRKILQQAAASSGIKYHPSGTVLTIEGPRFSSRAESKLFHSWGADCVNMTTVPEVILAKELGLCYAAIALVTDYDSWRDVGEPVSVEGVMETMKENSKKGVSIIKAAIPLIGKEVWSHIIEQAKTNIKCSTMLSE